MGHVILFKTGAAAGGGGGGEGGAIESVFNRTGVVRALAGDYRASQVLNDSEVGGLFVRDALNLIEQRLDPLQSVQPGAAPVAVSTPGYQVNVYGAAAGTMTVAARADHNHSVLTGTPRATGEENLEGTSYALARADHQHEHGEHAGGTLHALASPDGAGFMSQAHVQQLADVVAQLAEGGGSGPAVDVSASDVANDSVVPGTTVKDALTSLETRIVPGAAAVAANTPGYQVNVFGAAAGTMGVAARADHNHSVLTGQPRALGPWLEEGTSYALARADHQHTHGDQGGGSQHAVATRTQAGFASAALVQAVEDMLGAPGLALEPSAAPPGIGSSSARGQSTNAAHADHTHEGVSSFAGRKGAIVPGNDYAASQVANDSGVPGARVSDALLALQGAGANKADSTNTVNAGSGLTGGGAIGQNPTLAIGVINDAQHGQRGAGSTTQPLHAIATRTTPGFMSKDHAAAVEDMIQSGGPSGLQLATTGQPAPVGGTSSRGSQTVAAALDHTHVGVGQFKGRTGNVVPAVNDYDTDMVANVAGSSGVSGTTLSAALSNLQSAATSKVPATRTVATGLGLTGGGPLSSDLSLAVDGVTASTGSAQANKVPVLNGAGKLDPSFVSYPAATSDTVSNNQANSTVTGASLSNALAWLQSNKLNGSATVATPAGGGLKGGGALSSGLSLTVDGATTSAGAASAGKVPQLDSAGKLDASFIPADATETTNTVQNVVGSSGVAGTTLSDALSWLNVNKVGTSALTQTSAGAAAAQKVPQLGAAGKLDLSLLPALDGGGIANNAGVTGVGGATVADAIKNLGDNKVPNTVAVNTAAGSGLTGGGVLTTSRSLAVDGVQTSTGAAQGKVVQLGSDLKISSTLLPTATTPTSDTVTNVPGSSGVTGASLSNALSWLQTNKVNTSALTTTSTGAAMASRVPQLNVSGKLDPSLVDGVNSGGAAAQAGKVLLLDASGKIASNVLPASATPPTAATALPGAVLPNGSAAVLGAVTTRFAREDHQHALPVIAASAISTTLDGLNADQALQALVGLTELAQTRGNDAYALAASVESKIPTHLESVMPEPIGPVQRRWKAQAGSVTGLDDDFGPTTIAGTPTVAVTSGESGMLNPTVLYQSAAGAGNLTGMYGNRAYTIRPYRTSNRVMFAARVRSVTTDCALYVGLFQYPSSLDAVGVAGVPGVNSIYFEATNGNFYARARNNAGSTFTGVLSGVGYAGNINFDVLITLQNAVMVVSWRRFALYDASGAVSSAWAHTVISNPAAQLEFNGLRPAVILKNTGAASASVSVQSMTVLNDIFTVRA